MYSAGLDSALCITPPCVDAQHMSGTFSPVIQNNISYSGTYFPFSEEGIKTLHNSDRNCMASVSLF